MQTITNNQSRTLETMNETVNGINLHVLLESAAVNTDVPETDYSTPSGFDPSQVNVEVLLKRNGKTHQLINSNLGIIAHYVTILKGGHLWRKGVTLQAKSGSATHLVTRNLFIPFFGHINLNGSDTLLTTVQINRGAFGSAIDSANSNISVETRQSIGIEVAINKMNVYSIDGGQQSDSVTLGDNVTRVALMSFERDWTKNIFRSATLSSDRLDFQANEQSLITRHWDNAGYGLTDQLLDATANNAAPLPYPNTFLIHDKDEIDRAKVGVTMNSVNVVSSQNFIVYTTFETDQEIVAKAIAMRDKHEAKNIEKIPLSL